MHHHTIVQKTYESQSSATSAALIGLRRSSPTAIEMQPKPRNSSEKRLSSDSNSIQSRSTNSSTELSVIREKF